MSNLAQRTKGLYLTWTVLTFATSLFVLLFALFGLLWGGFGVWQVNLIALIAALSSAGLLFSVIRNKSDRLFIAVITLLSALPLPSVVIVLLAMILFSRANDATIGSIGWWVTFSIYVVQIFLTSAKIYQLRK